MQRLRLSALGRGGVPRVAPAPARCTVLAACARRPLHAAPPRRAAAVAAAPPPAPGAAPALPPGAVAMSNDGPLYTVGGAPRRNIAVIAHVDHGKTSLVDAMLRYADAST